MNRFTRFTWFAGFFISLLVLLASCSQEETLVPKADKETDTQVVAGQPVLPSQVDCIRLPGGDWGYPTPYAHYPRGPGGFKMALIFDSLLERDEKGLIPWLAQSYDVLEKGRVYLFTLGKNIRWQDGTPLTPEDVKFSIEYAGRHPMTWSYVYDQIDRVEMGEGNTVKIFLKDRSASMLYNLGLTRIIPKHIWENVTRPREFTGPKAVIGSGPYVLKAYSKEHGTYRFEAFKDFWGFKQRVKALEFIPVSEPVLAYEKGEINLVTITPDLLKRFEKDPTNKILTGPAFWGYRLMFNMTSAQALGDKRVRQAFAHAIDLKELVTKIARGAALPGQVGILPPDHVMAAPDIKTYDPDPRKAAMLLDQAGFDRISDTGVRMNATGTLLGFNLLCSTREVRMAEILRQRLAAVGIKITIKSVDGKTRDSRVHSHGYELAIIGHGGWGGDPDYLATHFAGGRSALTGPLPLAAGLTGFDEPGLAALLARQQTEADPLIRKDLVRQIQEIAAEQVPEIPLFYTIGYNVFKPGFYDGWMFMFNHHSLEHAKLSFLERNPR